MKPVLFIDFDGTLCHDRFWRSLDIELYKIIQTHLMEKNSDVVNDWMKGKYTSEEINKLLAAELNLDEAQIWNVFVQDCESMRVSTVTLESIHSLRDRYYTVLITNNMDCFNRFTIPSIQLDKYFDKIVNSYSVKKLKGDDNGVVFSEILQTLEAPISDSIVMDDSQKICDLFSNLGGNACLVSEHKNLDQCLLEISRQT